MILFSQLHSLVYLVVPQEQHQKLELFELLLVHLLMVITTLMKMPSKHSNYLTLILNSKDFSHNLLV
jgi:hypothetical protein